MLRRYYHFLSYLPLCIGAVLLSGAFLVGLLFFAFNHQCVDFSVLASYDPGTPSIVYDDCGVEWERFQLDKRDPVSIKVMPAHVINAFLAAEDWAFFQHNGLSWKGICRSALVNVYHGRIVQGASTITQQLVKLLFYDTQRTFKRKIKEQFLTLLVERQFTKEHILETYLNHVYFGSGMYGIEAAAQRFWGISVEHLSIEQAALLAAVICSPGHYSPLFFPYSATQRRNSVLCKMEKLSFISPEESVAARAMPLNIKVESCDKNSAPYVKEYIRTVLEEKFGKKKLYTGGLKIRTTINRTTQRLAQEVFEKKFVALRSAYGADLNGALISMDCKTGQIKALVGGVSFAESQFNRALYARRQQGSLFKPVLYAAALEKGMSLLDVAVDEPITIMQGQQKWEPRNHTRTYEGEMTLARALSYSNNIISAKLLLHIGGDYVAAMGKRCHLSGPLYPYPSLALGCVDSTLIEVVGMFNIFANGGVYCQPHLIAWVKDKWGTTLYRAAPLKERVISARIVSQIGQALTMGLERKRKYASSWIDTVAMSKTGTTNESRTCWFAGSTPETTTVVYVGCDDNRPMGTHVFPLQTAYPLWLGLHTQLTTTQKEFFFDPSLKQVLVDWKTGVIVSHRTYSSEVSPLLI